MEERIIYLFRKYLNNSCSKQEFEEFFNLLDKLEDGSPMKEELLKALREPDPTDNRKSISMLPNKLKVVRYPVEEVIAEETALPVRNQRRWWRVAAVGLLAVAGATAWMLLNQPNSKAQMIREPKLENLVKKSTARSEYKYLLLPDSSQVWLNAESTLEYPEQFGEGPRNVVLVGEAYFDVKHADRQPFVIYTGKVSTVVLGTAFNIKAYPDGQKITVTVKRGKVKVNFEQQEVALLTKGQEISIGTNISEIKEKKLLPPEMVTWHEGNLAYDDYSVADILADLQRVYDVKIRVEDSVLNSMKISTAFRREQGVEEALEIICKLTDKTLIREKDIYLIR